MVECVLTQGKHCVAHSAIIEHWTKGSMEINSWIFLKDGKPAFLHPPSQNGWLTDNTAAQHVWRTVKETSFKYLHIRKLNQDPLGNTLGLFVCIVVLR
jgi:hypothetical protein